MKPRSLARRLAILERVYPLFLDHGFEGVSMSMIAEAIGGSKQTLYNYFPSKAALFRDLMAHVSRQAVSASCSAAAANSAEDVEWWLVQWTRHFLGDLHRDSVVALHRLIIAEAGRFPDLAADLFAKGPQGGLLGLSGELQILRDKGLLTCDDTLAAARALRGLAASDGHEGRLWGCDAGLSPGEIEDRSHRAAGLFLRLFGSQTRPPETHGDPP